MFQVSMTRALSNNSIWYFPWALKDITFTAKLMSYIVHSPLHENISHGNKTTELSTAAFF